MIKKTLRMLLIAGLTLSSGQVKAQPTADYEVIPHPQKTLPGRGLPFLLTSKTCIAYTEGNALLKRNAEFLSEYIAQTTGYQLQVTPTRAPKKLKQAIVLTVDGKNKKEEGYTLLVDNNRVLLSGGSEKGVFYAVQTLRKSLPAVAQGQEIVLPSVEISDFPRFAYRGMMLDVGRHFYPISFIKQFIDLLAMHNINKFHWHLTEDQGWRLEIKKYPKLTEVGAYREQTVIGSNSGWFDGTPYGGFYTQDDAREIVKYAAERYITVIPEIDLPGHMLAALAAYPELGCTGGPYKVGTIWGVYPDVLCIGNPKVLTFLKDVMDEVMQIFPSKYIHIGGDEAPRDRWKACAKCQALIKEKGIKADEKHSAEDRLQSYCTAEIEKYLNAHGRSIIGWDEILEGDLAPNATVMSWRGIKGGIEAAKMNHDVIMTPNEYAYFDHYQSKDLAKEPHSIGGYLPVEKVYNYEPIPGELTPQQHKHILGAQANLWTEYQKSTKHVEYMLLPRLAALSEVVWSDPKQKNYGRFVNDLQRLVKFYKRDGFTVAPHVIKAEEKTEK